MTQGIPVMTEKERVHALLRREKPDRTPVFSMGGGFAMVGGQNFFNVEAGQLHQCAHQPVEHKDHYSHAGYQHHDMAEAGHLPELGGKGFRTWLALKNYFGQGIVDKQHDEEESQHQETRPEQKHTEATED